MVYESGQIFLPFCHNARVWRTDRRTDRLTEFSSQYRVCIACSAVKTNSDAADNISVLSRCSSSTHLRELLANCPASFSLFPSGITDRKSCWIIDNSAVHSPTSLKFGTTVFYRSAEPASRLTHRLLSSCFLFYWPTLRYVQY